LTSASRDRIQQRSVRCRACAKQFERGDGRLGARKGKVEMAKSAKKKAKKKKKK
jgi:hypothetical protein